MMHCPPSIRRPIYVLPTALLILASFGYSAAVDEAPDHRLRNAHAIFHEMTREPDKGIPLDLFDQARCVIIIPAVKKGAFVVGGKYGRGFASCRKGERGPFGAPAAIRIEGGSYGLQIGGSSTDVFMLIMNESGMERLLSDKFTIGGEAAATAGPVGRNASANTDVLLHAQILSWSRARGLFAGVSLEGPEPVRGNVPDADRPPLLGRGQGLSLGGPGDGMDASGENKGRTSPLGSVPERAGPGFRGTTSEESP